MVLSLFHVVCLGPFGYAFVLSFKLRLFSFDLHCVVGMWTDYNVHIIFQYHKVNFLQLYLLNLLDIYA